MWQTWLLRKKEKKKLEKREKMREGGAAQHLTTHRVASVKAESATTKTCGKMDVRDTLMYFAATAGLYNPRSSKGFNAIRISPTLIQVKKRGGGEIRIASVYVRVACSLHQKRRPHLKNTPSHIVGQFIVGL